MILKRLSNLWQLSKLEPTKEGKLRPSGKPKGMAKIVPLEDPIVDHFKDD